MNDADDDDGDDEDDDGDGDMMMGTEEEKLSFRLIRPPLLGRCRL